MKIHFLFIFVCLSAAVVAVEALAAKNKKVCDVALSRGATEAINDFSTYEIKAYWPEAWLEIRTMASQAGLRPKEFMEPLFKAAMDKLKSTQEQSSLEELRHRIDKAQWAFNRQPVHTTARLAGPSLEIVNQLMLGLKLIILTLGHPDAERCMKSEQKMWTSSCLKTFLQKQFGIPASELAEAASSGAMTAASSELPSLADVLDQGQRITSDAFYRAPSRYHPNLTVSFQRSVVDDLEGSHRHEILLLLRGLVSMANLGTGLKELYDLGERIVEIRGQVHGHWRIFGCLEGDVLLLKRVVSIKSQGSTYGQRIGKSFCKDMHLRL